MDASVGSRLRTPPSRTPFAFCCIGQLATIEAIDIEVHHDRVTILKAWLDQGAVLMDGARWFGEGHWFVAVGYDQNGISIRDSSGWDTRDLTWSRVYGEVGFSGWVVGVAS